MIVEEGNRSAPEVDLTYSEVFADHIQIQQTKRDHQKALGWPE